MKINLEFTKRNSSFTGKCHLLSVKGETNTPFFVSALDSCETEET